MDLAVANGGNYSPQRSWVFVNSGGNCSPNRVYRNITVPGGPLAFALAWTNSFTENTTSLVWGDVDGDGRLDLVAGNYLQPIRVYHNNGTGGFDLAWTPVTESTRSVALADYDGDGRLDIAVGNRGGPINIYRNINGRLTTTPGPNARVMASVSGVNPEISVNSAAPIVRSGNEMPRANA